MSTWRGEFKMASNDQNFLGETRIRLLEAIREHGSISKAAKEVPLSYKAAWEAVEAINNLAPEPVVERMAGGSSGGGTIVTEYGRRLIAFYRALEGEYQLALERLSHSLEAGEFDRIEDFRLMLRRMSMKTSARNQFSGIVKSVQSGPVDCEVRIELEPGLEIVALVTRESVENLGLTRGRQVQAMVKSSSVLLMDEPSAKVSARNRFCGKVTTLHQDAVNSEVAIRLPGNRLILTAVITNESCKSLGIKKGRELCALFKASSVFLAVND